MSFRLDDSKAMSTVVLVIMVGVGLVMFGMLLLTFFRGSMADFGSSLFSSVEEESCLKARDRFCRRQPQGTWKADNVKREGTSCADILNPGSGRETVFNCQKNEWTANICGQVSSFISPEDCVVIE